MSEAAFFEITDNELDGCRGTAVGLGPLPQSGHCGVGVEGVVSRAGHKSWLGVRPTGSGGTTSRKGIRLAAGLPRGAGGIAALAPTGEGPPHGALPRFLSTGLWHSLSALVCYSV